MSKTARSPQDSLHSNRHLKKSTKPHRQIVPPAKQKGKRNFVVFVIVAVLAAVPFSLGKYFEFNQPDPFDGGAYAYSARHILAGAKIGVEEKPSALLGTLLVNMLGVWMFGFNETGAELIQTIMQTGALVLMFIAMRKLFSTLSAAVGVIIAAVYLSAPLIAKFGNVKEQYMIAFMVMGISCLVLYQLGGSRWYALLAGALVTWAPLFKQTGVSAIGAIALFVIAQPLFKHRTWKQTAIDILLLLTGAAVALTPLYIWIIGWDIHTSLPYSFVWETVGKMLPTGAADEQAKAAPGYIAAARELIPFAKQWPIVLRYYGVLILPIALAAGAIVARLVRMAIHRAGKLRPDSKKGYDRFVLLFAIWWLLDMAFVWISPRSYEQYYLPLNASAAMLGGYLIAVYRDKFTTATNKTGWLAVGTVGLLVMIMMSWHIFFGIEKSPHSGRNYGQKRRGYIQKLNEISRRRRDNLKGGWEVVGEYIRRNSDPTDKIYVWGWYPGIYVAAQRFSSASKAFMMPRPAPVKLAVMIAELLTEFERQPPKFIVDSRKPHVPMDRPPYNLWPIAHFRRMEKPRFLPSDKNVIAAYDKTWSERLRKNFGEDEAERYKVMEPFRKFVMNNYEIVELRQFEPAVMYGQPTLVHKRFGQHVLFQLRDSPANKEFK